MDFNPWKCPPEALLQTPQGLQEPVPTCVVAPELVRAIFSSWRSPSQVVIAVKAIPAVCGGKGRNQRLLFPSWVISASAPACPSATLILCMQDPTAPKSQLRGQEGKDTSYPSPLPLLYRVLLVFGAANAPAASRAVPPDTLRLHEQLPWFTSTLQGDRKQKPTSGHAQGSTHTCLYRPRFPSQPPFPYPAAASS